MENNRQNSTNINWYPGHMAKTKRQIKERIDLVDVVIHVVDARIPKSSFVEDINSFTGNKEKIILMSKYDLCDKDKTEKWKDYYINQGYKVILSDINDSKLKDNVIDVINLCMNSVNKRRKEKGLLPKKAKVMIVGVSNVGKSTLINKLVGKKIATIGNKPGVTKSISMIKINDKIDLIDTPGVLWPKFISREVAFNLASMTIIKEEILPIDEVAIYILSMLNKFYKEKLFDVFGIKDFDEEDVVSIYEAISKFKHFPLLEGDIDYDKVSLFIINSIKNETIKGITFDLL
jgi:ribosome biogenesis GTPase A